MAKRPAADAHQPALPDDEPPHLARREALGAQHGQLARALEAERHEGAEHADERDHRGQEAQHHGDREGAVEDLEGALAQGAVRADQHVLVGPAARRSAASSASTSMPGAATRPSAEMARSSQSAS